MAKGWLWRKWVERKEKKYRDRLKKAHEGKEKKRAPAVRVKRTLSELKEAEINAHRMKGEFLTAFNLAIKYKMPNMANVVARAMVQKVSTDAVKTTELQALRGSAINTAKMLKRLNRLPDVERLAKTFESSSTHFNPLLSMEEAIQHAERYVIAGQLFNFLGEEAQVDRILKHLGRETLSLDVADKDLKRASDAYRHGLKNLQAIASERLRKIDYLYKPKPEEIISHRMEAHLKESIKAKNWFDAAEYAGWLGRKEESAKYYEKAGMYAEAIEAAAGAGDLVLVRNLVQKCLAKRIDNIAMRYAIRFGLLDELKTLARRFENAGNYMSAEAVLNSLRENYSKRNMFLEIAEVDKALARVRPKSEAARFANIPANKLMQDALAIVSSKRVMTFDASIMLTSAAGNFLQRALTITKQAERAPYLVNALRALNAIEHFRVTQGVLYSANYYVLLDSMKAELKRYGGGNLMSLGRNHGKKFPKMLDYVYGFAGVQYEKAAAIEKDPKKKKQLYAYAGRAFEASGNHGYAVDAYSKSDDKKGLDRAFKARMDQIDRKTASRPAPEPRPTKKKAVTAPESPEKTRFVLFDDEGRPIGGETK